MRALQRYGASATSSLVDAIMQIDTEHSLHIRARDLLVEMGPAARSGVPRLVEVLQSDEGTCRRFSARVLAAIGPDARAALPALLESLNDEIVMADAAAAIRALQPEDPKFIGKIADVLYRSDWRVSSDLAAALGSIGPEAGPALVMALTSSERHIHDSAARVIRGLPPEAAVELGKALTKHTGMDAAHLTLGLKELGTHGIPILIDLVDHPDPNVRTHAIRTLRDCGPRAADVVPKLLFLLEQGPEEISADLLDALAKVAPSQYKQTMEQRCAANVAQCGDRELWVRMELKPGTIAKGEEATVALTIGIRKSKVGFEIPPDEVWRSVVKMNRSDLSVFTDADFEIEETTLATRDGTEFSYLLLKTSKVVRLKPGGVSHIAPVSISAEYPTVVEKDSAGAYRVVGSRREVASTPELVLKVPGP
jgi:HEAT repeat protein